MAIGVQTDMCTRRWPLRLRRPAGANTGPVAGDMVGCIGVSEVGRQRLRRGGAQDHRPVHRWRRLRHQRLEDVDHQRHAGRLVLPAGQHLRRQGAPNKSLIIVPMDARASPAEDQEDRHGRASDTAQIFFDSIARAAAQPASATRQRLHLPDAAVPGRASPGRGAALRMRTA